MKKIKECVVIVMFVIISCASTSKLPYRNYEDYKNNEEPYDYIDYDGYESEWQNAHSGSNKDSIYPEGYVGVEDPEQNSDYSSNFDRFKPHDSTSRGPRIRWYKDYTESMRDGRFSTKRDPSIRKYQTTKSHKFAYKSNYQKPSSEPWWSIHLKKQTDGPPTTRHTTGSKTPLKLNYLDNEVYKMYEKELYVYLFGNRGKVCGTTFTEREASVACHCLGYSRIGAGILKEVVRTEKPSVYWYQDLTCVGTEDKFSQCSWTSIVHRNCDSSYRVYISCQKKGTAKLLNTAQSQSKRGSKRARNVIHTWWDYFLEVFGIVFAVAVFAMSIIIAAIAIRKKRAYTKLKQDISKEGCDVYTISDHPPPSYNEGAFNPN